MKRILLLTFIIATAVSAIFLMQGQHYITLSYADWAAQIQLWVLLLGLLAFILVYLFLSAIYRWFSRIPSRWSGYWKNRREQQTQHHQKICQEALEKIRHSKDIAELKKSWYIMPSRLRHEPDCAAAYVRTALKLGEESTAAEIIEWQLRQNWKSEFVTYYGLLTLQPEKRLKHIHQWLIEHPRDAALLLAAGRLYKRAEQWGNAEQYLQQSISENPSVAAYLELAAVQQQFNKTEQAWRSYQMASQIQRAADIATV